MIENAWFEDWFDSPYYHLLYNKRDLSEAHRFIDNLLAHLVPKPNSKMLDVACGMGRHSMVLASYGHDVTGIDLSPASIQKAINSNIPGTQFFEHDMRLPFRINYFDHVFNFFTSFGYFKTDREHHNAIRTMVQALKPNGYLLIDYLNVRFSIDHLKENALEERDNISFHITKWHDDRFLFKQIQVSEKGKAQRKHLFTEKVAKFGLADFNEMLSLQNAQIISVFGDYELGPYDWKHSPRLIILARKTK